jgi:hypothetical protein
MKPPKLVTRIVERFFGYFHPRPPRKHAVEAEGGHGMALYLAAYNRPKIYLADDC